MFDADGPDLDMVGELRAWAHEQGWTALDTMLVCLCLATELAASLPDPEPAREMLDWVQ